VGNGEYMGATETEKLTRECLPHNTVTEREGINESYSNDGANATLNRPISKLKTEKQSEHIYYEIFLKITSVIIHCLTSSSSYLSIYHVFLVKNNLDVHKCPTVSFHNVVLVNMGTSIK
jgi:hypothetical protein